MFLEWLRIGHVRNLDQARIDPSPGINLFTGPNASGKTAILESLYMLARARSFRTPRVREVIGRSGAALQVSAGVSYAVSGIRVTTGIEKGRGQVSIRYNGRPVRTVSEQARQLPLVLVTPDSHRLVSGTPKQRRHWLDWAMFHVEPSYLEDWRDYFRALRHRNSLIKSGSRQAKAFQGWERQMADAGSRITRCRAQFIADLAACLAEPPASVLSGPDVAMQQDQGWPPDSGDFATFLSLNRNSDCEAGFTRHGPHRADLLFTMDNIPISGQFSRGQIKLFVCRLMMAQACVLERRTGEPPLFLLDDYTAELDRQASANLLAGLRDRGWQCFLNATEFREQDQFSRDVQWFHVKHGKPVKMVE